jgi:ArsR family transcriptional regulator, arsenate/arsenite/antimonite-responsive transcriptional repressor
MDNELEIESLADVFHALSDPNRLRILELLKSRSNPICVNAIAGKIGITQSAISQHLKILRHSGLVSVKKHGYYKHYSLNFDNLDTIRLLRESVLGPGFSL